jgi:4'-phosphopantetheinyl transferase
MSENWTPVNTVPVLDAARIHFWRIPVSKFVSNDVLHHSLLSDDEWARARRFLLLPDRDRFVAGRVALRWVLGAYLGVDPRELRFGRGHSGKPFLLGNPTLHFNLSHSGCWIVTGVAWNTELGVDVEKIAAFPDWRELGSSHLGPSERRLVETAPDKQKVRALLECWVCKEAYLKMRGCGLVDELARIEMHPRSRRVLPPHARRSGEARPSVHLAAPSKSYISALVADRSGIAVELLSLTG